MEENQKKIEAILFSFGRFVKIKKIAEILKISEKKVNNYIQDLKKKYENDEFSFQIEYDDKNVKMGLKEEYNDLSREIISDNEIPKSAMKILSVIAYEQPITKTALAKIIGRNCEKDLEYLFSEDFLAKKEVGIGVYYSVSKRFFTYFDIDEKENLRDEIQKRLVD